MSTPTPRTDAAVRLTFAAGHNTVCPNFARELERELTTERARLDWLDNHLNYELMITVFGEAVGLASDGGPRELRSAIDAAMKDRP